MFLDGSSSSSSFSSFSSSLPLEGIATLLAGGESVGGNGGRGGGESALENSPFLFSPSLFPGKVKEAPFPPSLPPQPSLFRGNYPPLRSASASASAAVSRVPPSQDLEPPSSLVRWKEAEGRLRRYKSGLRGRVPRSVLDGGTDRPQTYTYKKTSLPTVTTDSVLSQKRRSCDTSSSHNPSEVGHLESIKAKRDLKRQSSWRRFLYLKSSFYLVPRKE